MKPLYALLRPALVVTAAFLLLLCGVYPLAVHVAGQFFFPGQSNGSLIVDPSGTLRGSRLIGQTFTGSQYFHSRPSALDGMKQPASGGSNLGPTSRLLADQIRERIDRYRKLNALPPDQPVPADAVTASASGLDPHISPWNARLQSQRVAKARNLPVEEVDRLITEHIEPPRFGLLGEPTVNVLELNIALEKQTEKEYPSTW